MSRPRIVFMGTPEFAVASLDALVEAGLEVAAVVSVADKPAGRGLQLRASPVKQRAIELGIPVLQPLDLQAPDFLAELDRTQASLYLVVAFRKLPREVYARPKLGCVNLHASLLPDYRGAAPINWAVIRGETRTGVTTFFIEEKIDTGDMIAQRTIDIGPDDTAGEVHDRLMTVGAELLVRTTQDIIAGTASRLPQPESASPQRAPKLTPELAHIAIGGSQQQTHDHIRGLSPHPGAWARLHIGERSSRMKILKARKADGSTRGAPGTVTLEEERLFLQCADGRLELLEVQPEGRRTMSAAEFARGVQRGSELQLH